MGKAIVIDKSTIYAFSLAGRRQLSGVDVTSPKEAQTTVIAPTSSSNPDAPDATETFSVPNGIELVGYVENSGSVVTDSIYAFTALSSLKSSTMGAQTVNLYGFTNPSLFNPGDTKARIGNIINGEQSYGLAYPTRSQIKLCFKSGGTNQSAWIIIGNNTGSGTAVRTEMRSNSTCA